MHAFEPVEEIAAVLRSNAAVSETADRLTLHTVALGAADAVAALYLPLADHGLVETSASLNPQFRAQHAGHRQVRVARLDALLMDHLPGNAPVLLKIDVESREPDVLRGAQQLLKLARPAVVCELLPGYDRGFFQALCSDASYTHFTLDTGAPVEGPLADASDAHRDHLFLPVEHRSVWLAALLHGAPHAG